MKRLLQHVAVAAGLLAAPLCGAVEVDSYIKKDLFGTIRLSPTGEYLAATVPLEDRTALAIIRRSDRKITANFAVGPDTHVSGLAWVNDERVLFSINEQFGSLDQPVGTGEIFAINADGGKAENLIGFRVQDGGLGTMIKPKKAEEVAAYLVDDLPADDRSVIVSIVPFATDPYTRAERLDVYTGRRVPITIAPVRNASFVTDHQGTVRFAYGVGVDNNRQLHYRPDGKSEWKLISDDRGTGISEWPVGFSADDGVVYLEVERTDGPSRIVAWDPLAGTRKEVLRDAASDPLDIIYKPNTSTPVGVFFAAGKPRTEFIDPESPEARLYRSLERAFGGSTVEVTSTTSDGRVALVRVTSDRNPGDFYLFDTETKKADFLLASREWFDPEAMNPVEAVSLPARDGLTLHGFLTRPRGAGAGTALPLIVLPHGGPFGIRDDWAFDSESQMLASAGYAVLRVNFRGSGGYGRAFRTAGAKQWGGTMQDDLTDATRWAIQKGVADPQKICIYGASYGAYASLMGVAREPDLYRCAAGYVGVYDLPVMVKADSRLSRRSKTWMADWVGTPEQLAATSPNRIADRIKVPVFLAAGGEDLVAPIEHTEMMEKALRKAGVPVEALYYDTEGHGFYKEAHRREYYTRLLAFFAQHLGGSAASAPAKASK